MTSIQKFGKADGLFNKGIYDEASDIYLDLIQEKDELAGYCYYRLASIANNVGKPMTAYDLYYKAFSEKPDLAAILYGREHTSKSYIFEGKKEEQELTVCPFCNNTEVYPKWCYPLSEATGYNHFFNPVRLWMYCEPCHHMFARHFPEKLFMHNNAPRRTNPAFFSYYSNILSHIAQYSKGLSLFEVGIGACECLLAAREMGYDTFGIDVIDNHVQIASTAFGLDVQTADFVEFDCEKKFDVIIMGDVIEHVSEPIVAMQKACDLLNDGGAIWISTPNFDSAFSLVAGHDDAMKRQQYHLNYFSRHSFFALLSRCGLKPVDYTISSHYKGSMEIIAVKA